MSMASAVQSILHRRARHMLIALKHGDSSRAVERFFVVGQLQCNERIDLVSVHLVLIIETYSPADGRDRLEVFGVFYLTDRRDTGYKDDFAVVSIELPESDLVALK